MRLSQHFATTESARWRPGGASLPARGESMVELAGSTDQTFFGFGGCFNELGHLALCAAGTEAADRLLDDLFSPDADGLRLRIGRVPVGASDYASDWYSHDETPGDLRLRHFSIERDHKELIPFIRRAQQRRPGLDLWASPWSPPTWMKTPSAYAGGSLTWTPDILRAYAQYLGRFVQAYAAIDLPIGQMHVQNEPTAVQNFPSCVWDAYQFARFIGDHLGPVLARQAPTCDIWVGTINDDAMASTRDFYRDYVLVCMHDEKARQYVRGASYQWAGRHSIESTHRSFPELALAQSENECGDGGNTWSYARYVAELFRHYLNAGVGRYSYWNMVLPRGGRSSWGWRQNSLATVDPVDGGIRYEHEFWIMKHFSRFIEPGAVRERLRGPWSGRAVAFRNVDGSLAVVTFNPLRHPVRVNLFGDESVTLEADSINTIVLR
ncbi:glycoside hydrolase family 30 protein [Streptomyces montanisoli]|uniref:Glycosyl hydrolase n=1 Tax=Streptomyces montanisoli TaxID=2798581 RepID=A0A940M6R7_9ACTN|nr:glycoside hydrolase family 30 beta sandwich domain-containing protein [Streptomyces montanisoli]MBP0457215.1 hypothetical protein [Streptomyces montanisoli]